MFTEAVPPNPALNLTPNSCAVGFPPRFALRRRLALR
jgi:hypothetical protein